MRPSLNAKGVSKESRGVAPSLQQVQFGGPCLPQAHILKTVGLHGDKGQQAWGLGRGSSQRQPRTPLYGAVQGPD